jgi:hypothetical protein
MDYPGVSIPGRELLEPYNQKDLEHLLFVVWLNNIQRHSGLASDNSLWDLITASDQEFERAVAASRDEHVKHGKGDIVLNYKKWANRKYRNKDQEAYISYLEKQQANYRVCFILIFLTASLPLQTPKNYKRLNATFLNRLMLSEESSKFLETMTRQTITFSTQQEINS